MEEVGYCFIKKDADSGIGKNLDTFINSYCRVMEFAEDGGVLVLNNQAKDMAMFDKKDVAQSFKCSVFGEVICPPDMDYSEKLLYSAKVWSRKGGYNSTLKQMVIIASLHKGKLSDDFLFSLERDQQNNT